MVEGKYDLRGPVFGQTRVFLESQDVFTFRPDRPSQILGIDFRAVYFGDCHQYDSTKRHMQLKHMFHGLHALFFQTSVVFCTNHRETIIGHGYVRAGLLGVAMFAPPPHQAVCRWLAASTTVGRPPSHRCGIHNAVWGDGKQNHTPKFLPRQSHTQ